MRGGYLLFLELEKPSAIRIGRLGHWELPAGLYVYAGSGLRSVEARARRHLGKKRTKRWHIDYLTTKARTLDCIAFESERRIECDLARSMESLGGKHLIGGFGSSDCKCESHLLYLGGLRVTSIHDDRSGHA